MSNGTEHRHRFLSSAPREAFFQNLHITVEGIRRQWAKRKPDDLFEIARAICRPRHVAQATGQNAGAVLKETFIQLITGQIVG